MKKSVMLMVGILAVALAGSAQAAGAPMFAVQNGTTDVATIDNAGEIGVTKMSIGINATNVPNFVAYPTAGYTVAQGNLHAATSGSTYSNAAMLLQHAATLNASSLYSGTASPNFSFYRINKDNSGVYSLPAVGSALGFFNFGTLDTTKDPNDPLARKNTAFMLISAEASPTNTNAWTQTGGINNTPSFFAWYTASNASTPASPVNNVLAERMRLSSAGNLGIGTGTATPTSKLQVVGLAYYSSNANALAGGLTAGAFYKCGGNGVTAYVAPPDTASQSLCIVY
jgi:hypothetical protein